MSTEKKDLVCEYCNNKYSNAYNLSVHQKSAAFCIKIQTTKMIPPPEPMIIECMHCNATFVNKYTLQSHLEVCKVKKKKDYETEKAAIMQTASLQKELELVKQSHDMEISHLKKLHDWEIERLRQELDAVKKLCEEKETRILTLTCNPTMLSNRKREDIRKRLNGICPEEIIGQGEYDIFPRFCSVIAEKYNEIRKHYMDEKLTKISCAEQYMTLSELECDDLIQRMTIYLKEQPVFNKEECERSFGRVRDAFYSGKKERIVKGIASMM